MTIQKILLKHKAKRKNLLPALQEIIANFGYISKENLYIIADYFKLSPANLYGVITAGEYFKIEKPKVLEIKTCSGGNCKIKGSKEVLREVEKYLGLRADKSNHPRIKLETSSCLGRCNRAPILIVNGIIYEKVKPQDVDDILKNYI
ncbi:MAG: hypothetical protein GF347_01390 [Candidatus Moranbacteria bacterium]|nr:hypothetical protein [Candidatus Moranbacteria bacterium]